MKRLPENEMGVSFTPDMRIAGYRPTVFKDALRGFLRTCSPGNLVDLKSIFPHRRDGAIVFEECLDRGLIVSEDGFEVSETGIIIAHGKARRRTPLAQALTVLDDFLTRADVLNRDPDAVQYMERIWLFGSVMLGKDTVGDIDLALETTRRPEYCDDYMGMARHLEGILSRYGDVPAARNVLWSAETWVTERVLYGARRHALLAGVQNGVSDLIALGVPCRLVYDRARGGRIDDPIMPRHPQSNGRDADLAPPAQMPDLTPSDIRPMDGRWAAAYADYGIVSPSCIFRGWTDETHKLFPRYPDGLRVIADGHTLGSYYPWVPKSVKRGGLDGRNAIALVNASPASGTCVILQRRVERAPELWTL